MYENKHVFAWYFTFKYRLVMKEQIVISLTTWSKRINNIPVVLDTIFSQTLPPDLVVLNLAYEEKVPESVQEYINIHGIEVNRVPDTKVYKKLIPTLKKYPNDCVISIDDDWLYPEGMIADFMDVHKRYPNNPISGNREIIFNMQCHCGCASLTKAEFFGKYLEIITDEIINNCPSDDIVYTFFANQAGYPYVRTKELYFTNMEPYNDSGSYSKSVVFSISNGIKDSYKYLVNRYGQINDNISLYIKDDNIYCIISDIYSKKIISESNKSKEKSYNEMYSTKSYRIGNAIVRPFSFLFHFFKSK